MYASRRSSSGMSRPQTWEYLLSILHSFAEGELSIPNNPNRSKLFLNNVYIMIYIIIYNYICVLYMYVFSYFLAFIALKDSAYLAASTSHRQPSA